MKTENVLYHKSFQLIAHFLYQPVENKHKNWGNPRLTKEMVKSRFKGIYTC